MDNNPTANVDDLTSKLDQMNVKTNFQHQQHQQYQQHYQQQQHHDEQVSKHLNDGLEDRDSSLAVNFDSNRGYSFGRPNSDRHQNSNTNTSQNNRPHHHHQHGQQLSQQMSVDEENIQPLLDDCNGSLATRGGSCRDNDGCTLIVTKLDPAVLSDKPLKTKFESLFLVYDEQVTFRYLNSFRHVRLDFTSSKRAELARIHLSNYQLGTTTFECYSAQIVRPNFSNSAPCFRDTNTDSDNYHSYQQVNDAGNEEDASGYLEIPKLTRQHLISPPMLPPVGWEPKEESSLCIDVQLLSAIANLVPGQTHEIHVGNGSQPGIFVEVCEDASFDSISSLSCRAKQLPKTMISGTPRPGLASNIAPLGGQGQDDCCQMQS